MANRRTLSISLMLALAGCGQRAPERVDAAPSEAGPRAALVAEAAPEAALSPIPAGAPYVPPQCYTKTRGDGGRVHNPCFTCHADAAAPNYIRDGALQTAYSLAPPARVNPWTNLFVDRSAEVAAISDAFIRDYVREDNYTALADRLQTDRQLDLDGDGAFSGFVPDIAFRFDERGFDRTRDGGYTGWRVYAYHPLPGTFWPTNGSFGDGMIRLPAAFREAADGQLSPVVYATNLALLEALITRRDVPIEQTDERVLGVDIDGDGQIGRARVARYRWQPSGGGMQWAGRAASLLARGEIHLAAGLFPEGTELAHSLRYLDVEGQRVRPAQRMKELRYMVKTRWVSYGRLEVQAADEAAEKSSSPDKTRLLLGDAERGIGNGAGWRLSGFIEDEAGALRPQTLAEQAFCIGCHSGVGVTDDSVFSFGRKLSAQHARRGWYHWSHKGLEGLPEPMRADGRGEYTHYLTTNGAGDELRQNDELLKRFFRDDGTLRPDMEKRAHADVATLLLPSPGRALALDKAYLTIVREQSFVRGRDATLTPAVNVHRELPEAELETGVAEPERDRRRALPVRSEAARRSVPAGGRG